MSDIYSYTAKHGWDSHTVLNALEQEFHWLMGTNEETGQICVHTYNHREVWRYSDFIDDERTKKAIDDIATNVSKMYKNRLGKLLSKFKQYTEVDDKEFISPKSQNEQTHAKIKKIFLEHYLSYYEGLISKSPETTDIPPTFLDTTEKREDFTWAEKVGLIVGNRWNGNNSELALFAELFGEKHKLKKFYKPFEEYFNKKNLAQAKSKGKNERGKYGPNEGKIKARFGAK